MDQYSIQTSCNLNFIVGGIVFFLLNLAIWFKLKEKKRDGNYLWWAFGLLIVSLLASLAYLQAPNPPHYETNLFLGGALGCILPIGFHVLANKPSI